MPEGDKALGYQAMRALSEPELARRLSVALQLADHAAHAMRDEDAGSEARLKGWADWVTGTDVAIERHVRAVLAEMFPEDAVVGEELPSPPGEGGRPTWYVDPIDGTTNFVHGLKSCSFSLALADRSGIALGVVADPWRNEVFKAVRGQGAWANGVSVRCRQDRVLEGALVLTELAGPKPWPGMSELMARLGEVGCVTRVLGSCALSLANVAAGRASALVLGTAHPIDLAAAALMAREAGAVVLVSAGVGPVLGLVAEAAGKQLANLPMERALPVAFVAAAPGILAPLLELLKA